jgi:hypothetical protein
MKNTEFVYYTLAIDRKADLLVTRDINLLEFFWVAIRYYADLQ